MYVEIATMLIDSSLQTRLDGGHSKSCDTGDTVMEAPFSTLIDAYAPGVRTGICLEVLYGIADGGCSSAGESR